MNKKLSFVKYVIYYFIILILLSLMWTGLEYLTDGQSAHSCADTIILGLLAYFMRDKLSHCTDWMDAEDNIEGKDNE